MISVLLISSLAQAETNSDIQTFLQHLNPEAVQSTLNKEIFTQMMNDLIYLENDELHSYYLQSGENGIRIPYMGQDGSKQNFSGIFHDYFGSYHNLYWSFVSGFDGILPLTDGQYRWTLESSDDRLEYFFGISLFKHSNEFDLHHFVNPDAIPQLLNFVPDPTESWNGNTFQSIYDTFFQSLSRNMVESYAIINSLDIDAHTHQYLYAVGPHSYIDGVYYLNEQYHNIKLSLNEKANEEWFYSSTPELIGFWLRRHNDGSDRSLYRGLKYLLELYDSEWLNKVQKHYPKAELTIESLPPTPLNLQNFDPNGSVVQIESSNHLFIDGVPAGYIEDDLWLPSGKHRIQTYTESLYSNSLFPVWNCHSHEIFIDGQIEDNWIPLSDFTSELCMPNTLTPIQIQQSAKDLYTFGVEAYNNHYNDIALQYFILAKDAQEDENREYRKKSLYMIGTLLTQMERFSSARKTFALLESEFPTDSYADDAAYWQAKATFIENVGDVSGFLRVYTDYPQSDHAEKALYMIGSHDYMHALTLLREFPDSPYLDDVMYSGMFEGELKAEFQQYIANPLHPPQTELGQCRWNYITAKMYKYTSDWESSQTLLEQQLNCSKNSDFEVNLLRDLLEIYGSQNNPKGMDLLNSIQHLSDEKIERLWTDYNMTIRYDQLEWDAPWQEICTEAKLPIYQAHYESCVQKSTYFSCYMAMNQWLNCQYYADTLNIDELKDAMSLRHSESIIFSLLSQSIDKNDRQTFDQVYPMQKTPAYIEEIHELTDWIP